MRQYTLFSLLFSILIQLSYLLDVRICAPNRKFSLQTDVEFIGENAGQCELSGGTE